MKALDEVREMLILWDSGSTVWTLERGGLGPGYEQALQVCMIEICRAALKMPRLDKETKGAYWKRFGRMCDRVVHEISDACCGFSGAQVGAARDLAFRFVVSGIKRTFASYKKQRPADYDNSHIMISKHWPKAPEYPVAKGKIGAVALQPLTNKGQNAAISGRCHR
jgi:hypothetical protein